MKARRSPDFEPFFLPKTNYCDRPFELFKTKRPSESLTSGSSQERLSKRFTLLSGGKNYRLTVAFDLEIEFRPTCAVVLFARLVDVASRLGRRSQHQVNRIDRVARRGGRRIVIGLFCSVEIAGDRHAGQAE